MKKKKLIALFAGLSLAFVSSAALAAPSADTLLVAGYDSNQMAVLYGVSSIDQPSDTTATLDCTLVGMFEYTRGEVVEGVADVETLTSVDQDTDPSSPDDTTFEPETVVTSPDNNPPLANVDYGAEGAEECSLTSVAVDRDGEVNHGAVVSTFARLGKGCIVRHFAQSDFGKADYDDPKPELFEVTLQSIKTSCDKQKDKDSVGTLDDDASSGGKANAPGQADKANKADKGGGKANAPGQEGK